MALIYGILMVFFLLTCLLMILVILLQPGKSDVAALGGAAGNFMGGGGAATFLTKLTTGLAVTYMVLVIALGKLATGALTQVGEPEAAVDTTISVPAASDDAGADGDATDADSGDSSSE